MALEHALLVALTERSGSGYELARRFDRSIGFFHSATHQQIYRTLRRMAETGWVDVEVVEQDGKPDKKVYSPSPSGRTELARWIAEPSEPTVLRDELAVKIRGAAADDRDALVAEIVRHRASHADRLAAYRAIEQRDFPDPASLSDAALRQYLVLRGGLRIESGFVDWCDDVLDALRPPTHRGPALPGFASEKGTR
ncbi:PadR family transcriptional regulator [Rhodococcus rhodnii]|nr:PadR family transcriptional regulator [Rhodococcus rhodnii]TXG92804.1 PadR family transcriptional regulator [Rhodococcus rhodnii]